MIYSAGDFNQRVLISASTFTKDAVGGMVRTDPSGASLCAKVEHVGAGERFQDGALQTRPELRVLIRWREGVRLRDRVSWRGVDYEIIAEPKEPSGRQQRRTLELLCIKRKPGGGS